jgi:hypothetical protein
LVPAKRGLKGEVSINFRSETFPLEKMVNTDQMMRLNDAHQGAGRAAMPAPATSAAPAPVTSAAPAPATSAAPPKA